MTRASRATTREHHGRSREEQESGAVGASRAFASVFLRLGSRVRAQQLCALREAFLRMASSQHFPFSFSRVLVRLEQGVSRGTGQPFVCI